MEGNFLTYAEAIEHIILNLLADGSSHKRSEILSTVKEKIESDVNDVTIQNTISFMIRKGECVRVSRGTYASAE